jgi:hypothetical protein
VSPYKAKTNQAWAADGPLKIVRLSTNEKGEAVKEKVNINEIGALKRDLNGVLNSGKILQNAKNRAELLISLNQTSAAIRVDPLAPIGLIEELQEGIKKISDLLPKLEKYRYASDFITNQAFKVDAGVVGVLPVLPLIGPIDGAAFVRMQELLRAWQSNLKKLPTTDPSRPDDDVKHGIVSHAHQFFRAHSAKEPSAYPKGPFSNFAVSYCKWVTGKDCQSLGWHIRKVLNNAKRR